MQGFLAKFAATATTASSAEGIANNLITSETANVVGSTESFITQLVQAATALSSDALAANLPVIGQVANGVAYLQQSAQDAATQLQQLQAEFEDAYCTPAVYTPPTSVPANLTGAPLDAGAAALHACLQDGR
jgi:hypothetical protein